jgi:27-O-demethylrifamycin SV methyltransferase
MKENQIHYNTITDAWQKIMGDNFHFGYFKNENTSLSDATDHLIDRMIGLTTVTKNTKILDVGCGIGNPAFYLHEKFKCRITGISNSDKGVKLATIISKNKGYFPKVKFQIADGTSNGFPDESFNLIWVMESSHLMIKKKLIGECFRVLKKNGVMLLCDLTQIDDNPFKHTLIILKYLIKLRILHRAFGKTAVSSQEYYWRVMHDTGFKEITSIDISDDVLPTMKNWKTNTIKNKDRLTKDLHVKLVDEFIQACDVLEVYYKSKIMGYTIFKAIKY